MGHEDSIVSDFIAILLILVFVFKFIEGLNSKVKIDLNNIELFTIQDIEAEPISKANTTTKKTYAKKTIIPLAEAVPPVTVKPRNSNGYTQLQQDCFDALKSLGVKTAKERKFIVNNTFNQHNPQTIQEFLKVALS